MIVLSERLQEMANNIEKGEKVADIGTDHGYLPLYLYEKGISPVVILTDVSKGSLDKAIENYNKLIGNKDYDFGSNPIFRLGDGLEPLEYGEVDAITIAGMGGLLMTEIMDWDFSKTLSYKKYILQPRNNGGALRRYLYEHGIEVEKLIIVPEDSRFAEIMVCRTPASKESDPLSPLQIKDSSEISDLEFDFPDILRENLGSGSHKLNENTRNYLVNAMEMEARIVDNIKAGRRANSEPETDGAIEFRENRIERIKYILNYKEY